MDNKLFRAIKAGENAHNLVKLMEGRTHCQLGIVADVEENSLQRAKVVFGSTPQTMTDWLQYISLNGAISTPILARGDTVLVCHPEGDPNVGIIVGVIYNGINPPRSSDSLVITIGDNQVAITPEGININANKGYINMFAEDNITMVVGDTAFSMTSSNAQLNGSSIATVGARDDGGDSLITKGWS